MCYIELNPVRARMVEHPDESRWSSYAANAQGQANPLLSAHPLHNIWVANLMLAGMPNANHFVTIWITTSCKDLKVKGSSSMVKVGAKVKNIHLVEGDHNLDCKIDGIGPMALKSEFVKKA